MPEPIDPNVGRGTTSGHAVPRTRTFQRGGVENSAIRIANSKNPKAGSWSFTQYGSQNMMASGKSALLIHPSISVSYMFFFEGQSDAAIKPHASNIPLSM